MSEDCAGRGFAANVAILWAAAVAIFALLTPIALWFESLSGVFYAFAAALACLTGATAALWIGQLLRGPDLAIHAMLAGMAARMGIPLAVVLVYTFAISNPAKTGMLYYLAVFYATTLTVETILTLPAKCHAKNQQK